MNELLFKYQMTGDLADSVFAILHAGNCSAELNEVLDVTYEMLTKERATVYKKIRERNEGV